MNCSMFSLEKLCYNSIVENFEQLHLAFTLSKDEMLQRDFLFLQRKYSTQLATALYDNKKLKAEYLEFLLNKHLYYLDGQWLINSRYQNCIEEVFRRLPNLKKICFRYCKNQILEYIATYCPKIVEIDISRSNVTDKGVQHLWESKKGILPCPRLKNLFLKYSHVTDIGAENLIRKLPSLERFEYSNIPLLLHSISENHSHESEKLEFCNLVELNLLKFSDVPSYGDVLKSCLTICPKLESFSGCILDEKQSSLFNNIHLKKLEFFPAKSNINVNNFLKVNGCLLTYLKVVDCTISVSLLGMHCPVLKELIAKSVIFTVNDDLKPNFSSLTELNFSYMKTSSNKAVHLLLLSPKLESVSIDSSMLSLDMKKQILSWWSTPCAKKIAFKYISVIKEMVFLWNILSHCFSLKEMTVKNYFYENTIDFNIVEMYRTLLTLANNSPDMQNLILFSRY